MAKKQKPFSLPLTLITCLLAFVIGAISSFLFWTVYKNPKGGDIYVSGDLQIHFMELGNKATGDSIYIKAGDTDILIDAGSVASSSETTSAYIKQFCTDNKLEYVIVTHADSDHIAGFAGSNASPSIFDRFTCETIITFNKTKKVYDTDVLYTKFVNQLNEAVDGGANHYNALECYNNEKDAKRIFEVSKGIEMEILYQKYYEEVSSDENNHSVCLMFNQGDKHFLFTGDLEKEGEASLAECNELPEVELFKAGHHGSKTSSTDILLSIIKPKIVCVCCCAGYNEYNAKPENVFPTQAMIDRVANYTDALYITSLYDEKSESGFTSFNGNIVVTSNKKGVNVDCSNSTAKLKDTDWFKNYRKMPPAWEGTA